MVAIHERREPKLARRARRFGERWRAARFMASVDVGPTGRFAVRRRDVDTLVPTAAPNAAQEPPPRSKQPTPPPGSRAAHETRTAGLRAATSCVLAELARIAFADLGEVFDGHGGIIPLADLPPGIRSAIAEYRTGKPIRRPVQ